MTDLDIWDRQAFEARLVEIDDVDVCAELCCAYFRAQGYQRVSVYLLRSGRLRRVASVGYWQVFDGFPLVGDILDLTRPEARRDTPEWWAGRETSSPIFADGELIGALDVEVEGSIDAALRNEMSEVGTLLGLRITELGGLKDPSGWKLLADNAPNFASSVNEPQAIHNALEVAIALTGLDSAMYVADPPGGTLTPADPMGPASNLLTALSIETLAVLSLWVHGPRSCYTMGDPSAIHSEGHELLARAGLSSLAVTAVDAAGSRLGFLLVASTTTELNDHHQVEQLEVLAALLGSAIRNSRHLGELLSQTRRDPLTELGHSQAFDEKLISLRHDQELMHAVFMIDIDHFKSVNDTLGHQEGDRQLKAVAAALKSALRDDDSVFRIGGDEFAAVIPVDDELQARAIGERIVQAVAESGQKVSVGGAFSRSDDIGHRDVFVRADEALYLAKRRGRNQLVVTTEAGVN